jgi:hypothetical protein
VSVSRNTSDLAVVAIVILGLAPRSSGMTKIITSRIEFTGHYVRMSINGRTVVHHARYRVVLHRVRTAGLFGTFDSAWRSRVHFRLE